MPAYLLTWNPSLYTWDGSAKKDADSNFPSLSDLIGALQSGLPACDRWSTGVRTSGLRGGRFFLLRQGVEPKGIVGSGWIISDGYQALHWSDPTKSSNYADIQFDALVDADASGALSVADIKGVNWNTPSRGILIQEASLLEIESRWAAFVHQHGINDLALPDELLPTKKFREGAGRQVWVNAYERNKDARDQCIRHFGHRCQICELDFGEIYGAVGSGFIHVHHLIPIANIADEYEVDPINDLLPVCPNCHAMLHRGTKLLSPAELREILNLQKFRRS